MAREETYTLAVGESASVKKGMVTRSSVIYAGMPSTDSGRWW